MSVGHLVSWSPLAIGLGIIAYAVAVAFYTLLGVLRLRRADQAARRQAANSGYRTRDMSADDSVNLRT